jgi:hypothetical protein
MPRSVAFRDLRSAPRDGSTIEVKHGPRQEVVHARWSGQGHLPHCDNRGQVEFLDVIAMRGDTIHATHVDIIPCGRRIRHSAPRPWLLPPLRRRPPFRHTIQRHAQRIANPDPSLQGDVPLIQLALRCSKCGKTGHKIIVLGQS